MNDIYSMIELLGVVPGYFFALVIGLRKKNHPANIILSLALFAYATQLLALFLVRRNYIEFYTLGLMVMNGFTMIAWPLFYRYISLISAPVDALNKKYFIHAFPLLLYLFGCFIPAILIPDHFKFFYISSMVLTGVVTASYNVAMLISLLRYRREIQNFFSEIENLKATWIQFNLILWFAITIDQIVVYSLQSAGIVMPLIMAEIHGTFINIISTAWVYVIGYFAVTHPDIFKLTEKMYEVIEETEKHKEEVLQLYVEVEKHPELPTQEHAEKESEQSEKADSHTDEKQDDRYAIMAIEKIEKIMRNEKPYLNDQLTIAMLASRAGIPAYLLGKIINRRLDKNFITYINEYRINDIKEKLKSKEHKDKNIIEIAYETGFRSKSAFNTFFKKVTGVTPTEFRGMAEK